MTAAHSATTGGRASTPSLRDELAQLIADDGLVPGDRLPTEARLAERFGVARSTIREALKRLEEEGLVDAVQGKGRFVSAIAAAIVERPITRYEGVSEMLSRLGYAVTTSVFSVGEVEADAAQAESLQVEPGTPLIRLARLRYGDDEPLVFSVDHVLRDALPGPIAHRDWSAPLTESLEAYGQQVTSSVARISAVELPFEIARRHRLTGLGPWLLVTETCLTRTGRRVLLAEDYHRGAAIGFNVRRQR
ncbi:GntR family transcriptional regulator [Microbacterium sp. ASV49]|uniref:GntR family transcriptional regulator n=1 Tax=Microbacterium candidum TaxID=3041922 RepID=A0ABT7MXS9_9MICO|nr:GntR family transcriptional regulator [Microbacterium sp. ASV49]MDL9979258.1 GntR family transcriptional regulator [Microbacterium sp. ASV49]